MPRSGRIISTRNKPKEPDWNFPRFWQPDFNCGQTKTDIFFCIQQNERWDMDKPELWCKWAPKVEMWHLWETFQIWPQSCWTQKKAQRRVETLSMYWVQRIFHKGWPSENSPARGAQKQVHLYLQQMWQIVFIWKCFQETWNIPQRTEELCLCSMWKEILHCHSPEQTQDDSHRREAICVW